MATDLTMPALSPTMEKGTLAKWLVSEGARVKPGDLLAEIETEKATMEFEAVQEGWIAKLVVPEGTEDVAVGTVIAVIASGREEGYSLPATSAVLEAPADLPPPASEIREEGLKVPASLPQTQPEPERSELMAKNAEVNASPLARRIAASTGVALDTIKGTGLHGKIVKADLAVPSVTRSLTPPVTTLTTSVPAAVHIPPSGVPAEEVKLSAMRKTIARRLTESKTSVPHFYLTARCNLDPLLSLRSELNRSLEAEGIKLSVNDMLLKALAISLTRVPEANVQFGGDVLYRFGRVDVSMAVAIDGGLITPVLRGVGSKSLSCIARESKAMAEKARQGALMPEDYAGGTVSLSNLGMFGIDEMFPVINPPQAVILGVAAGIRQPWEVNGELGLATIMSATGSFDHRAIDGATAAEVMRVFRGSIENPLNLVA